MLKVKSIKMDKRLEKYLKEISSIRAQVKIGFFEGAKYPNGTPVAVVAFKNETGSGGNPRRPFMHRTLQKNQRKWVRGIASNLKGKRFARPAVKNAYSLCGQVAVGDIKETISSWPAGDPRMNRKSTIMAKAERAKRGKRGRNSVPIDPSRALIDTGRMIASVTYKVEV